MVGGGEGEGGGVAIRPSGFDSSDVTFPYVTYRVTFVNVTILTMFTHKHFHFVQFFPFFFSKELMARTDSVGSGSGCLEKLDGYGQRNIQTVNHIVI